MAKQNFLFLVIATVGCMAVKAQENWTLEQCVQYGLENNLPLLQMRVEKTKLEIRQEAIKNNRLPSAEMNASQRFNFGRSLNRENVYEDISSYTTGMEMNVELPLFDGFHTRNALRENRMDVRISDEDMATQKDELTLNITNLFYRAAIYKEVHKIALEQRRLTEDQLQRSRDRIDAGMAPKGVLPEIEAQHAEDELTIVEARGNLDRALIELAQLMNMTENVETFDVAIPSVPYDLLSLSVGNEIYTDRFPQFRSAQFLLEGMEWTYRKTRSGYFPTLSLGGSIGSSYYHQSDMQNSPFSRQLKNNRQSYIYIALRIPLFDKFVTRTNLRMVKADIQNQAIKIREIENTLHAEAMKIKTDLENSRQKVVTANKSVVAHTEAFRFSTEKFNVGKISVYEHLQAKQRLANSQSQAVQAKYELAYKQAVYDYYYDR